MSEEMVQAELKKMTEEFATALSNNQPLDQSKIALFAGLHKLTKPPAPAREPVPNRIPIGAAPSTSGFVTYSGEQMIGTQLFPDLMFGLEPASGTTRPPISHFPTLQPLFEEATAHSDVSALYKEPKLAETSFQYIFNPAGSYRLPQSVEKHSPTAWTLFDRFFQTKGSVDIRKNWEELGADDKKKWRKLSSDLRKERASQKEKGYITY